MTYGCRFGLLVMCREQMTDIISTLQEASQTQSPDCNAVRRRSMHSLPADTNKIDKDRGVRALAL